MNLVEFSTAEKAAIVDKVKRYVEDQLDQEIGSFEAEFLLDFFAEKIGGHYYNRGLQDAQAVLSSKLEEVSDALYELEKST